MAEEFTETLVNAKFVRVEKIVSAGHVTPTDSWYDQDDHEFVVVIQGSAILRFQDEDQPQAMKPGDWINIPAHRKHRVDWTTRNAPTVWLAIHYTDD